MKKGKTARLCKASASALPPKPESKDATPFKGSDGATDMSNEETETF
jgi:hypothetical protein